MQKPEVVIHSDGACLGNPGPGGYGTLLQFGSKRKELSAGFRRTTNNRMELLGAIAGLEALQCPCKVELWSDSQYLVKAMTEGWLAGWQRRGWRTATRQPVKNRDLWERLLRAIGQHEIEWRWVRGHSGDPANERCDTLAVTAARGTDLAVDVGFVETD